MMRWFQVDREDDRAVGEFMAAVASLPARAPAPDPMQLWWKAQLLRRWDAQRRAQVPLDVMQPVEIAASVSAAAFLLYRSLPYLF